MAQAIKDNETKHIKNCHYVRGASSEIGCYQMKPTTYRNYSIQTIGYVAPRTEINEKYIVTMKAQEWLDKGQTPQRILLSWNAGEGARQCGTGINSYGVKFDSCTYVRNGLLAMNK